MTVPSVVGKTCPYCQTPIKPDAEVVICSDCGMPHHRECWQESRHCTTFGCAGKPSDAVAETAPSEQPAAGETLPFAKKSSRWKVVFNLLLLVGLVGIFAWQVSNNWDNITQYQWQNTRWDLAVAAFVVLLICSLLDILIWNRALSWFTQPLPFIKVMPVFIWSNLARYIPGKVASLFLRTALGMEAERPPVPVLASSALELALRIASALLIFVVSLTTWGHVAQTDRKTETLLIIGIVIIVTVFICAHPKIMMPVLNWGLKKIKQPQIDHTLRYRDILGLVGMEITRWVLVGISFVLLSMAIFPPARHAVVALIGLANASWAAGFILMTPAGMGPAEYIQYIVLGKSLHFPTAAASIIPVASRVWSLAAEGFWALAALPLYARWSRSKQK